jgi:flagellar hook protein FlgE
MRIIDILKQNPSIFEAALCEAMVLKIATDSANAGGVTTEIKVEEIVNKSFASQNLPFILTSNKGLDRILERGSHSFDFSIVGAKNLKELKALTKTSDSIASAADLFLFEIRGTTLKMVDSVSFKTSTADSSNKIYLHNDADGSIYDSFTNGQFVGVGQVVMMNFYPKTRQCNVYYFDKTMQSFSGLFSETVENNGTRVMHGNSLAVTVGAASDRNRTIVSMTNRAKATKKKDGSNKASTSFNRGITIARKSMPLLQKRGALELICSFEIPFDIIEEHDYNLRYPQL